MLTSHLFALYIIRVIIGLADSWHQRVTVYQDILVTRSSTPTSHGLWCSPVWGVYPAQRTHLTASSAYHSDLSTLTIQTLMVIKKWKNLVKKTYASLRDPASWPCRLLSYVWVTSRDWRWSREADDLVLEKKIAPPADTVTHCHLELLSSPL